MAAAAAADGIDRPAPQGIGAHSPERPEPSVSGRDDVDRRGLAWLMMLRLSARRPPLTTRTPVGSKKKKKLCSVPGRIFPEPERRSYGSFANERKKSLLRLPALTLISTAQTLEGSREPWEQM